MYRGMRTLYNTSHNAMDHRKKCPSLSVEQSIAPEGKEYFKKQLKQMKSLKKKKSN